jgi:hypothetical protein
VGVGWAALKLAHLTRRFLGSLRRGGPNAADEAWVCSHLLAGEAQLWHRMSGPDRRHAAGVAHRVADELGADVPRPVLAAALLHDVGKVESGLGTAGRVVATTAAAARGHEAARQWADQAGYTRRIGLYLLHAELGAELLAAAGSDPLTVAWAAQHHDPPERWTVPRPIAEALKAADDD